MPAAVAAWAAGELLGASVAAAVMGSEIAATTFLFGTAVTGTMVASTAISLLVGSALNSMNRPDAPSMDSSSFASEVTQRSHIVRSNVAPRNIVYGQIPVSGPLVFCASSTDNNTLYMVVVLAGHEVEEIGDVYLNDELSTADKFSGYVTINKHLGATDQAADADLVAANVGWTTNHRLRGCAYVYLKLTYNRDVFARGIPNVKAVIKGKKLYDPRTGTTVWSSNSALAVRDYLTGSYGLASTSSEILDAAFITEANICDESITLATTGTEKRYTCNGSISTESTPRSNMEQLLSSCGGVVTWPAGQWVIHTAAYESPTVALTADDFAGPIKVRARVPRQQLFNAVKGTFVNPDKYWQPGDFTPVTNSTYATQDGAQIFRDIAFPMTTSNATAQRLAKIMVEKSRQGITAEFPAKLTAFKLNTWQTATIDLSQLGWSNKVFRVTGWGFGEAGIINVTVQEESSASYAWSAEEVIADPAPDSNLPDSFTVETPASLSLDSGTDQLLVQADGFVISRIKVSWPAPVSALAVLTEIQTKTSTETVWQTVARPASNAGSIWLTPVQDAAIYNIRARFENTIGIRGAWFEAAPHTVVGQTAAPADVTNLHLSIAGPNQGLLTCDIAEDVDVVYGGQLVIRHSTALVGATWESAFDIASAPGASSRVNVALVDGTYLAKWLDSSGHISTNAAVVVSDMASQIGGNYVLTQTEGPSWSGVKTNAVLDGTYLTIANSAGTVLPCGTYAVPRIDLGAAYLCNLSATIPVAAYSTTDLVEDRSGLIDSWLSIDGAIRDMTTVELWVRSTPSDPSIVGDWGIFQPHPVNAAIFGRAFDFEIRMYSYAGDQNVYVEQATFVVDMPERTEKGIDVSYTSGTLAITFDRPFFAVPAISITGQSMAVGDFYTLTSKSATGFSIQFRNSGGSDIARTFDWFAAGF